MKTKCWLLLTMAMLTGLSSAKNNISPGQQFPRVTLPSISTDEPVSFETFLGKKLVLHLFASW